MKKKWLTIVATALIVLAGGIVRAELQESDKQALSDAYSKIQTREKGPYASNTCTCVNGERALVADQKMRVRPDPCREEYGARQLFCSAYRSEPALSLAGRGVYVGNIFSNEVDLWNSHADHHRLVKGFILEKYQMDREPDGKLAVSRAYRGISGAEFEAKYAPIFYANYYRLSDWSDFRHYLLQYELQRRFFLSSDMPMLADIRSLSLAMHQKYEPFKPVKELIHNRLTADQARMVEEFQRQHPKAPIKKEDFARLSAMIRKLTDANPRRLEASLTRIKDPDLQRRIRAAAGVPEKDAPARIRALAELSVTCRELVAGKNCKPEEAVEAVDVAVVANQLMQVTASRLAEQGKQWTASELLSMAKDLMSGGYGAGLISRREFETARASFQSLLSAPTLTNQDIYRGLERAGRVAEWAQSSIQSALWEVWEPWVFLFPDTRRIADDIIRSSPLVGYASVVKSLRNHLSEELGIRHEVFGRQVADGVRALNPGLAAGPLKFFENGQGYTRNDILALESTNAELEPVAGIITRDEGNMVSHVQLLARALGIPNAVFQGAAYDLLPKDSAGTCFYAITPMGRVIFKDVSEMNETDRAILDEYEKNKKRGDTADLRGSSSSRLAIDASRLNLKDTRVLPLESIRRKHFGVICGPKAAFLGELKHLFPDHVSRGSVIPFGVYFRHFSRAAVAVPEALRDQGIAVSGSPLPEFVRATYDTFFNAMAKDTTIPPEQLASWIETEAGGDPPFHPEHRTGTGFRRGSEVGPSPSGPVYRRRPTGGGLCPFRHQCGGPAQLQRRGPQLVDLQSHDLSRCLGRNKKGVGVPVHVPLLFVAADRDQRSQPGVSFPGHSGICSI